MEYKKIEFYKIKDFKDYYISKCGKILSTKYNDFRILKHSTNKTLYPYIRLYMNNKAYSFKIHRLLAKQFIINIENKPCINHKNGIKTDYDLNNLEWCTYSENTKHSYRVLKNIHPNKNKFYNNSHCSKKIKQYNKNGDLLKTWECIKKASDELNIVACNISKCCLKRPRYKTAGGFIWRYEKFT